MKLLKTAAFSALITAGALCQSVAAETVMRVGTWLPPTNPQNATVWPTWAKWVEEATEGRVKVQMQEGLGHPKTLFNLVEDGVVDVSFSVMGYLPGRFKLPMIAEVPNISDSAEATSVALWRTQEKYFAKANELDGLELLGMFVHGPAQIHTREEINSLDDLKNKKIRTGGGMQTVIAERLGVTSIGAPAPKVYEMMQQGVVDGAFFPVQEQRFLRLAELSKQVTVIPKGLYANSFAIFANPEFMEDLDPRDREAIMKVSGEKLSALAGKAWEDADKTGYKAAEEAGVRILRLKESDPMLKEIRKRTADLADAWMEDVKDRNVDAKGAYKYLKSQAASYKSK
ncbi:MAG: TRAP transporter substrate-binding protein [Oceanobacter sp.]